MSLPPLSNRQAIESAAASLRAGRLPPRWQAERIVKTLDSIALALALGGELTKSNDLAKQYPAPKQLEA